MHADAEEAWLAGARQRSSPLQLVRELELVLDEPTQARLIETLGNDAVLELMPLSLDYKTRLLKQLIAAAEGQGRALSEELVEAFTSSLLLPKVSRQGQAADSGGLLRPVPVTGRRRPGCTELDEQDLQLSQRRASK